MKKIIKNLSVICALCNMITVNATEIKKYGERNTIQLQKDKKFFVDESTNCKINLYDIDATIDGVLVMKNNLIKVSDARQMGYMVTWDEKERTLTLGFDISKRHEYKKEEVPCNYKQDEKIYKLQKSDIKLLAWLNDGKLYELEDFYVAGDEVFINN